MSETSPPPGKPFPGQSLRRVATTVYGTLLVLWLLVPRPVVDWWDETAEKAPPALRGIAAAGQTVARAVAALSESLHLADAYPIVRERMKDFIEK